MGVEHFRKIRSRALIFVAGVVVGLGAGDIVNKLDNQKGCIQTEPLLTKTIETGNYSLYTSSGLDGSEIKLIVPNGVPITADIPQQGDVARLSLKLGTIADFFPNICQNEIIWKVAKSKTSEALGWLIIKNGSVIKALQSGPTISLTSRQADSASNGDELKYDVVAK